MLLVLHDKAPHVQLAGIMQSAKTTFLGSRRPLQPPGLFRVFALQVLVAIKRMALEPRFGLYIGVTCGTISVEAEVCFYHD